MITINIAEQFTKIPGPRFKNQGNGSGEEFREDYLKPAFEKARKNDGSILIKLEWRKIWLSHSFSGRSVWWTDERIWHKRG